MRGELYGIVFHISTNDRFGVILLPQTASAWKSTARWRETEYASVETAVPPRNIPEPSPGAENRPSLSRNPEVAVLDVVLCEFGEHGKRGGPRGPAALYGSGPTSESR